MHQFRFPARIATFVAFTLAMVAPVAAQQLTPTERTRIDSTARAILVSTGAPSASIAIVRGGALVYEQAYGEARPGTPATPSMRYAIGSVSKQFTAAAILLLAEEGKLSLDARVATWFPRLTRANDITLRQLLSMTSGYQDYWPQDYVFTAMQKATTPDAILQQWAGKALDFTPGTQWQYSNTNYIMAARIVEMASGMPFMEFLQRRIFTPLGMTTVADFDSGPLGASDAAALLRHGLGPLRAAPKEGARWLFGAGQLAMTAADLAKWNIAMIQQRAMSAASYRAQQATTLLNNGVPTGYGLGVNVGMGNGQRRISHGGAVSGYTTTNIVLPDDRAAITVFTNIYPGGGGANGQIASRIASIIFSATTDTSAAGAATLARRVYDGLMTGTIDRTLLTPNASDYFTAEAVADYGASLGTLGAPTEFTPTGDALRGGLRIRSYRIRAGGRVLSLTMMLQPDGKIEQYVVERAG